MTTAVFKAITYIRSSKEYGYNPAWGKRIISFLLNRGILLPIKEVSISKNCLKEFDLNADETIIILKYIDDTILLASEMDIKNSL